MKDHCLDRSYIPGRTSYISMQLNLLLKTTCLVRTTFVWPTGQSFKIGSTVLHYMYACFTFLTYRIAFRCCCMLGFPPILSPLPDVPYDVAEPVFRLWLELCYLESRKIRNISVQLYVQRTVDSIPELLSRCHHFFYCTREHESMYIVKWLIVYTGWK